MSNHPEPMSNGVESPLTAQEWRVAQLVASGLTSRQVALRLLCSPRTVDNHVAHILHKLELSSRHDLAFLLNSDAALTLGAPRRRARLYPFAMPAARHGRSEPEAQTAAAATVHLGRLRDAPDVRDGMRLRLRYLRDDAMVVLPTCRADPDRWHCTVVATRGERREGQVLFTETDLAHACRRIDVYPDRDPDGFARLAWPTRAFQLWPGGAMFALALLLAERLRPDGSLCVPAADLADHDRIAAWLPNTRPADVGGLVDRMVGAGLLTGDGPEVWRLTLPRPGASHEPRA